MKRLKKYVHQSLTNKNKDTKLIEKLGEEEFKKICFSTLTNDEISKLL